MASRRAARRGRDGRRVRGHPPQRQARGGRDAPPGALPGPRGEEALPPRGLRGQRRRPPGRRGGARRRRGRGRLGLPRHGAARGAHPGGEGRLAPRLQAGRGRGARRHGPAPRRPLRRPRQGHRPPRPQARERVLDQDGAGQGARLRPRPPARPVEGQQRAHDHGRQRHGHARVHAPRAGAGQLGHRRRPDGPLGRRRHDVQPADGAARARGRQPQQDPARGDDEAGAQESPPSSPPSPLRWRASSTGPSRSSRGTAGRTPARCARRSAPRGRGRARTS